MKKFEEKYLNLTWNLIEISHKELVENKIKIYSKWFSHSDI